MICKELRHLGWVVDAWNSITNTWSFIDVALWVCMRPGGCVIHLPRKWGIWMSPWPNVGTNGHVRALTHVMKVLFTQDRPHQRRLVILYAKHYRTSWHLHLPPRHTCTGLFSDEFLLCITNPSNTVEGNSGVTPGIVVWGAIGYNFSSPLVEIQGPRWHSATM